MSDFFPPTRDEILHELARELAKRREVFPRWVVDGKLKQADADARINRMQAGYDFLMHNLPT